jgi:hypothetical protein
MSRGMLGLALIALAPLAAPHTAQAQMQTYYHAGGWDAFSGRNEAGGAVCGIGSTNPIDNRRLTLRFDIGGTDTAFSVEKPDWSIPDGTRVPVVMQVGLNAPWTMQATGHGHSLGWTLDPAAMSPFDRQFRGSASMTLTFPAGNEPPWTVPLTGSSAIADTLNRCVRDLTRQVQAARSAGNGAPAAPGAASTATQPFTQPPGASPAETPAQGGEPSATQPVGTLPAH